MLWFLKASSSLSKVTDHSFVFWLCEIWILDGYHSWPAFSSAECWNEHKGSVASYGSSQHQSHSVFECRRLFLRHSVTHCWIRPHEQCWLSLLCNSLLEPRFLFSLVVLLWLNSQSTGYFFKEKNEAPEFLEWEIIGDPGNIQQLDIWCSDPLTIFWRF